MPIGEIKASQTLAAEVPTGAGALVSNLTRPGGIALIPKPDLCCFVFAVVRGTFEVLIEEGHLQAKSLQYPGYEDDEVDYVFIDPKKADELPDDGLIACERTNFREEGRNVLNKNGSVSWMDEVDFPKALKRPENAPLAEALKRGPQPLKVRE